MKHLFACLKKYRAEAILAPLFKLCEVVLELLVPLAVAEIARVGTAGEGDISYIVKGCLVLVAFGAAGLLFALTAQYFAAKAAVGVSSALRERLFVKLQSLSFPQIDGLGTPAMLNRITSDVNGVQSGVNMTLRILLRSPFVVFGAMAMAFVVDPVAGCVFAGMIPVLLIVVFAVMAATAPLYRNVQRDLDGVYSSTRENLAGVRVVRAFRREGAERELFSSRAEKLKNAQKKAGRVAAVSAPLTFAIVNAAAILLVYAGGLRVEIGALTQEDMMALYGYLSLVLVELIKLANLIVTVSRAVACQKRVGAVLDLPPEPSVLSAPDKKEDGYAVSFENVEFSYAGGGAPVLKNITFSVKEGETVGVLGGTGSGKSTLISLLPRFYAATKGTVRVGGENVNGVPYEVLREKIAVVPQRSVLFRGTIRENLQWGRKNATDEELLAACKAAQALDVLEAKGGLDGTVEQEGRNLSGGQKQRLAIARALVKDPEILILDDSASALDYATDARLRASLKERKGTTFIVSQRAASLMHADLILVLDDGKIVGAGTHEELLSRCGLYREIYRTQFKEEEA